MVSFKLVLSITLVFFIGVHADNTPQSHRSISAFVNQFQLQFHATSFENSTVQDQFQFEMNLLSVQNGILNSYFHYQRQDGDNKTHIQYKLDVVKLIEFSTEKNEFYNDQVTTISEWPLAGSSVLWQPWVDESISVEGVTVYTYSAVSVTGLFVVRVNIAPSVVELDGSFISPNDVKIDFEMHEYPQKNQTRLALQAKLQSETDQQNVPQGNKVSYGEEHGTPFCVFSWEPTAVSSDGEDEIIAWTPTETENKQTTEIFFTFLTNAQNPPTSLVWDVQVGLDYGEPFCVGALCGGGAVAVVIIIVLVIVGLLVFVVVKMRKRDDYQQL